MPAAGVCARRESAIHKRAEQWMPTTSARRCEGKSEGCDGANDTVIRMKKPCDRLSDAVRVPSYFAGEISAAVFHSLPSVVISIDSISWCTSSFPLAGIK
jgi:hypothetical protein